MLLDRRIASRRSYGIYVAVLVELNRAHVAGVREAIERLRGH